MSDSSNPQPQPPPGFPQPAPPSFGQSPLDLPPPGPIAGELGGPSQPGDEVPVYDRREPGASRRAIVLSAVVALVVGLAGGFVAGRQTAPKGPATLADAVRLASQGKLPTGTFTPGQGGLGGLFRGGNGQGTPFSGGQGQNGNGQSAQRGQGATPTRSIQGTVSSVAGDVVTLQTGAGQLQIRIGPSTKFEKAAKGSRSDLAAGNRVVVTIDFANSGNSAGNGSVTAASILSEGAAS